MAPSAAQPGPEPLPTALLRVSAELSQVLSGIRLTRETIQSYSVERLRDTHDRLSEVTSTTETAAMQMLNGLDRTLAMIDELERSSEGGPPHQACDALRAEVNQLYGHLQFQDIIAQQLSGVAGLLVEVEQRVRTITDLFDDSLGARDGGDRPATGALLDAAAFNPDASMRDTSDRQAAIDEAFKSARTC